MCQFSKGLPTSMAKSDIVKLGAETQPENSLSVQATNALRLLHRAQPSVLAQSSVVSPHAN